MRFQDRVGAWMQRVFSEGLSTNARERALRHLEEATELAQAMGINRVDAMNVVDYVMSRPAGQIGQEISGSYVTLAAICATHGFDLDEQGEREIARLEAPEYVGKVRAAQERKRENGMSSDESQLPRFTYQERIDRIARYTASAYDINWDALRPHWPGTLCRADFTVAAQMTFPAITREVEGFDPPAARDQKGW